VKSEAFLHHLTTQYREEPISEADTVETVGNEVVDSVVRIVESLQTLPAANKVSVDHDGGKQLERWYECAHVILGAAVSEMIAAQVHCLDQVHHTAECTAVIERQAAELEAVQGQLAHKMADGELGVTLLTKLKQALADGTTAHEQTAAELQAAKGELAVAQAKQSERAPTSMLDTVLSAVSGGSDSELASAQASLH